MNISKSQNGSRDMRMPRLTLPNHAQTRCKNREGKACITHEGRRCAPCPAILPDKQETQTSTHTNTVSQSLMEVNDDGQPSRFRCMRLTQSLPQPQPDEEGGHSGNGCTIGGGQAVASSMKGPSGLSSTSPPPPRHHHLPTPPSETRCGCRPPCLSPLGC